MLITAPFNTSPLIRRFFRVLLINSLLPQSSQMNGLATDCLPNVDARHVTVTSDTVCRVVRHDQEETSSLAACLIESESSSRFLGDARPPCTARCAAKSLDAGLLQV